MYRRDIWYLYWFYVKYITYKIPSSQIKSQFIGGGSEAENRNLTEEKMNIKLNIEILIEELRTTILWVMFASFFVFAGTSYSNKRYSLHYTKRSSATPSRPGPPHLPTYVSHTTIHSLCP